MALKNLELFLKENVRMKNKAIWILLLSFLPTLAFSADLTKVYAGDPIIAEELNDNFAELEERISELKTILSNGGLPGEPFRYDLDLDLSNGYDYYVTDIIYPGGFVEYGCPETAFYISLSGTKDGDIFNDRTPLEKVYGGGCNVSSKKIDFVTPIKVSGGQTLKKYRDLPMTILGYRTPK